MFPISNFSRILYRYSKIPTSEQDIPIVEEFQKIFSPDCNLSKRSRKLYNKELNDARFSTTESFERWFARILVYEIHILLKENSKELQYLKQICDPIDGCRCCESWNEGIYNLVEKEAYSIISALVESPSEFTDIFRKYGRKAMKNAWRRHFAHFEMLKQSKKRIEKALKEPEKSVPEEEFRNLPFVNYFDYDGEAPIYD
jgi:hypothetical protein